MYPIVLMETLRSVGPDAALPTASAKNVSIVSIKTKPIRVQQTQRHRTDSNGANGDILSCRPLVAINR